MHIASAQWWTGQWVHWCADHSTAQFASPACEVHVIRGSARTCKLQVFCWLGLRFLSLSSCLWKSIQAYMIYHLLRRRGIGLVRQTCLNLQHTFRAEYYWRTTVEELWFHSIFISPSSSVQQCPVSMCFDPDANHLSFWKPHSSLSIRPLLQKSPTQWAVCARCRQATD